MKQKFENVEYIDTDKVDVFAGPFSTNAYRMKLLAIAEPMQSGQTVLILCKNMKECRELQRGASWVAQKLWDQFNTTGKRCFFTRRFTKDGKLYLAFRRD